MSSCSRARDVTKINTFQVNSFGSGDLGPLGFVQEQHIYLYHVPYRKHTEACEFDLKVFEKCIPKVDILYVYPNIDLDILKYYIDRNDGLVIAASGNGSISDDVLPDSGGAQRQVCDRAWIALLLWHRSRPTRRPITSCTRVDLEISLRRRLAFF